MGWATDTTATSGPWTYAPMDPITPILARACRQRPSPCQAQRSFVRPPIPRKRLPLTLSRRARETPATYFPLRWRRITPPWRLILRINGRRLRRIPRDDGRTIFDHGGDRRRRQVHASGAP